MKTFVCDICGLAVGEYKLIELHKNYVTKDIKDVCPDCHHEIINAKIKIEDVLNPIKVSWIKKNILKMKDIKINETFYQMVN